MEEKSEKKKEANVKTPEIQSPNSKETKGKKRSGDRITLKTEVLFRINLWLSQIEEKEQSIHLSKNDLVNFLLMKHSPELTGEEFRTLGEMYYDEVRFTAWALKALRKARSQGEDLTLDDLIKKQRQV